MQMLRRWSWDFGGLGINLNRIRAN